jgi:hypothetical protein
LGVGGRKRKRKARAKRQRIDIRRSIKNGGLEEIAKRGGSRKKTIKTKAKEKVLIIKTKSPSTKVNGLE